jgi:hypothetical protein
VTMMCARRSKIQDRTNEDACSGVRQHLPINFHDFLAGLFSYLALAWFVNSGLVLRAFTANTYLPVVERHVSRQGIDTEG